MILQGSLYGLKAASVLGFDSFGELPLRPTFGADPPKGKQPMSVPSKLLAAAVLFIVVTAPAGSYACSTEEFGNSTPASLAGTNAGLSLSGAILTKGSGVHTTGGFAGTL